MLCEMKKNHRKNWNVWTRLIKLRLELCVKRSKISSQRKNDEFLTGIFNRKVEIFSHDSLVLYQITYGRHHFLLHYILSLLLKTCSLLEGYRGETSGCRRAFHYRCEHPVCLATQRCRSQVILEGVALFFRWRKHHSQQNQVWKWSVDHRCSFRMSVNHVTP